MIISVNGINEVKEFPVSLCDSVLFMDYNANIFYVKTRTKENKIKIGTYSFRQEEIVYV